MPITSISSFIEQPVHNTAESPPKQKGSFSGVIRQLKADITSMGESHRTKSASASKKTDTLHSSSEVPKWKRLSGTEMKRSLEALTDKDKTSGWKRLTDDEYLGIQRYSQSLYLPINQQDSANQHDNAKDKGNQV